MKFVDEEINKMKHIAFIMKCHHKKEKRNAFVMPFHYKK